MALRAFCKACLPDDAAPALGGAPLFGPDAEPRPGVACLRSVSASAAGSRQGTGINVGPRTTVDGLRRRACLLMGLDARRRSAATPDRAGGLKPLGERAGDWVSAVFPADAPAALVLVEEEG